MDKLKKIFLSHFEQLFIVNILIGLVVINYFIPLKLAFINFYFLPVIAAGIYLGKRSAVLGAFFCVLLVFIYLYLFPEHFSMANRNPLDMYLHIAAWGGFLLLAGAVVGRQQEKLDRKILQGRQMNQQLQEQQENLTELNTALQDYSENLEVKVEERTEELAKTNESVEKLKEKLESTLYSTMDSSVVKLMIEGRLRNEKRLVSVMFSDLVGFTAYSEERTPELVVRDLNRYLNDMEPIFLDYHGHIDKYMGDGIMCEFGAPLDYDNYRLMAVIAGLKMQEKMRRLDYPWQMRIGIASGSAITGLIGSRRQSYTSIGDVVNLSSRLENVCSPGMVLIDDFTLEGIERFVDVRFLKGVARHLSEDKETEERLDLLMREAMEATEPKRRADLFFQVGKLHLALGEQGDALSFFEKGIKLAPDHIELKLAYAETSIQKGEAGKIKVKGKKQRVAAYEVLGIKDVMLDRDKIPAHFYDQYKDVVDLITIPEDIMLPVESLDGSIGHSKVVAVLSYALAGAMGIISEKEKLEILHGAFVADIGKEVVPHHLLNRAVSSLNSSEHELVRKHSVEGVKILKKMGYDTSSMHQLVRHSHEYFNGAGAPDGLKEEGIPLGARIIAVADAYDAMTSWRPYREKMVSMMAFDELRKDVERGQFDPQVVKALHELLVAPVSS